MKITVHIVTSTLLGGITYAATGSLTIAVVATVSGVLIDLDHILDFFIFSGERFSIEIFFSWCNDVRWDKIALLLHSYELYFGCLFASFYYQSDFLSGILLGTGLHLLIDQVGNGYTHKLSPWFYFLTFRFLSGFQKEKLLRLLP